MSKVDVIYLCKEKLNKSINQRLTVLNEYDELYLETGDERYFQSSISICSQIEKIRKINKKFDELLIYIQELGGDINRSDLS